METYEQNERQKAEQRDGVPAKDPYGAPKEQEWISRNARRIVAIDIDGTITNGGQWFGEGYFAPIRPAVKARLKKAKANGWIIVIYSVRKDKHRIADFLDINDIPYAYIETKPCFYTVLVDDRAVPFDGDWKQVELPPQTLSV